MSTKNRPSNTEMVSVPREEIEAACSRFAKAQIFDYSRRMRSLLDRPADHIEQSLDMVSEQHQGEPVAVLYANGAVLTKADCGDVFDICCKVETPLYTRADPGEVERLRTEIDQLRDARDQIATNYNKLSYAAEKRMEELDTLRVQLAEQDSLLRQANGLLKVSAERLPRKHQTIREHIDHLRDGIKSALSAGADPAQRDHEIPGTSFQRLNMLANQGE